MDRENGKLGTIEREILLYNMQVGRENECIYWGHDRVSRLDVYVSRMIQ